MRNVRHPTFPLDQVPRHWVFGRPQTTHAINALHLVFPDAERGFIRTFRAAQKAGMFRQADPDVDWFIAQEGAHAAVHQRAQRWLASDLGPQVVQISQRMSAPLDRLLSGKGGRRSLRRQLAIIAAIEHFMIVLGAWAFSPRCRLDDTTCSPDMLALMRWHAAEEIEHRHVAFEAHRAAGGTRAGRVLGLAIVIPLMFRLWLGSTARLMALDPSAPRFSIRRVLADGREGYLPRIGFVLSQARDFLDADHDPMQLEWAGQFGDIDAAQDFLDAVATPTP